MGCEGLLQFSRVRYGHILATRTHATGHSTGATLRGEVVTTIIHRHARHTVHIMHGALHWYLRMAPGSVGQVFRARIDFQPHRCTEWLYALQKKKNPSRGKWQCGEKCAVMREDALLMVTYNARQVAGEEKQDMPLTCCRPRATLIIYRLASLCVKSNVLRTVTLWLFFQSLFLAA